MKKYGFVVRTNLYAGNFEREICAYMTGVIGECGVGDEYEDDELASKFQNISQEPDDHGCHRPVSILCGSLIFDVKEPANERCKSIVIYFESKPTDEQIEIMKVRAYEFSKKYQHQLEVLGFQLVVSTRETESFDI